MKLVPLILLTCLPACNLTMPPPTRSFEFEIGRTTRTDVLFELGIPLARYEGDQILCYYLRLDLSERQLERGEPAGVGEGRTRRWSTNANGLMLEFDERGVLIAENVVPLGSAAR